MTVESVYGGVCEEMYLRVCFGGAVRLSYIVDPLSIASLRCAGVTAAANESICDPS